MAKFSLLVPILNEEKNIETFIKLILEQEHIPEIVFVDGGSTDRTCQIIEKYSKNKNVKLIKLNERGTGKAINVAFKESTGDYVVHCGADWRFYDKDIFSDIQKSIVGNPGVISIIIPLNRRHQDMIKESIRLWDSRGKYKKSFSLIRRDLFPEYPEISYGEDKIATNRLRSKNPEYLILNKKYNYERGSDDFTIQDFARRYLWYGRTYNLYLNESKDLKEYSRIILSIFCVFIPPLLIIPALVGLFSSLTYIRQFPIIIITFPLLSALSAFFMGIGYLLHFTSRDIGH